MKILQIHNEYFIRGGEETVLNNERKLLLKNGHKVKQLIRRNKDESTSILNWFIVFVRGPILAPTLGGLWDPKGPKGPMAMRVTTCRRQRHMHGEAISSIS